MLRRGAHFDWLGVVSCNVPMDVVVHIPEDLARRLESVGDLPRRVLETIAVEEFRLGRLSQADNRESTGGAFR